VTVRAAVSVALAAALLGASMPAVDRVRVQHADARIEGEVERLQTVARSVARSNDVVGDGGSPARARVTVHLPVRSWGASQVTEFTVLPPGDGAAVRWQVRGGERRHRTLNGVALAATGEELTVHEGGRQRLVLELRRLDGERTVVVRRPDTVGEGAG